MSNFEFHGPLKEDCSGNGSIFNGTFIPEEILIKILSFVPAKHLLPPTLVCKKWCNIIKFGSLWREIYNGEHAHKAKLLPWYVYYLYFTTDNFKNLLKNRNGEDGFAHWKVLERCSGDTFKIECLPHELVNQAHHEVCPDSNNQSRYFVAKNFMCAKIQEIYLERKQLLLYIITKYKPHIYMSEWVSGRFDCDNYYVLIIEVLLSHNPRRTVLFERAASTLKEDTRRLSDKAWTEVGLLVKNYPENFTKIIFKHYVMKNSLGKDDFIRIAGGIFRFDFESINPKEEEN